MVGKKQVVAHSWKAENGLPKTDTGHASSNMKRAPIAARFFRNFKWMFQMSTIVLWFTLVALIISAQTGMYQREEDSHSTPAVFALSKTVKKRLNEDSKEDTDTSADRVL